MMVDRFSHWPLPNTATFMLQEKNIMNSALAVKGAAFPGNVPAAALQTRWKCAECVPDRRGIGSSRKRKTNSLILKRIGAAKIVAGEESRPILPQHNCHSATSLMRLIQADDYPRWPRKVLASIP
jgi:hypothetical protein